MAEFKITVLENGPILIPVQGKAVWVDAEGHEHPVQGKSVALCRCGHSANKPFCDGSHKQAGFTAAGGTITLSDQA